MKTKISKLIKDFLGIIAVIAMSTLIGTIFLIVVYMLPVQNMYKNASETASTLMSEGDYYMWIPSDRTSQSDNFTDALMIQTAIYNGTESFVDKAMMNPRISYEGSSIIENLEKTVNNERGGVRTTYARYWHGYLIILKPLLLLFNYSSIRWINTVVSCFLVAVILIGFYKYFKDFRYALAFTSSIVFLNPIVMRASLQFNTVFYVIMFEYIIALYQGEMLEKTKKFNLIFLLSGILVAFFDLLTYPIAALGMLLILQFLMFESNIVNNITRMIKSSIIWGMGYGGMWSSKWIIATLLTGENAISDAIENAKFRTGTNVGSGSTFSVLGMLKNNFFWFDGQSAILFKILILTIIMVVIILCLMKKIKIEINILHIIMLLLFCLIPIGRYMILKNHSFIHGFITYREGMVYVMAGVCLILDCIKSFDKRGEITV